MNVAFPVNASVLPLAPSLVEQATPAIVLGVYKRVADDVVYYIANRWPVDTGLSLAGWGIRRAGAGWEVYNPVKYTSYVHDELAEKLYREAISRAGPAANDVLRDRIRRRDMPAGTRAKSQPTPKRLTSRIRGPATRAAGQTVTSRALRATLIVEVQSLISAGRIPDEIETRLLSLIRAGRVEAAMRLLVVNGRRAEARKLARLLQ